MQRQTDIYIEKLIQDRILPGASYAYLKGRQVEKQFQGFKQVLPSIVPIDSQLKYDMASLTKVMMTNTVLLKLIETSELSIDQSLHYYLPEFSDQKVTIRHLLTHTSAINPYIKNRDQLNQKALKEAILQLKSSDERGLVCSYTDTGTILLGFLIEKIYQDSLANVFRNEVIEPLDMKKTTFVTSESKRTAPTEMTDKRGIICGETHDPKAFVLREHCGSAGLFSTLDDTIKFTNMMMQCGILPDGTQFLKEDTILNLLIDYSPTQKFNRSLGWNLIVTDSKTWLYHTGYTGTLLLIDPIDHQAFVFLSNRVHPTDQRATYLTKRDQLIQIFLENDVPK